MNFKEQSPEEVCQTLMTQLSKASVPEMIDALHTVWHTEMTDNLRRQLTRTITLKLSLKVLKDGYVN